MTEQLLQFIWQFSHYNNRSLKTNAGEDLQIIFPGNHNSNQGPDFINARIRCDNTLLAGSIEIHVNASEWNDHRHSSDPNYNNVILHVVWKEDRELKLGFPVLELQERVSTAFLSRYEELMNRRSFISCETQIATVNELLFHSWKERLFIERLQVRAAKVQLLLEKNRHHWEETFWQLLAANFGMKVNGEAFMAMAASLPVKILARHKNRLVQLEALLLGQCGLLEDEPADAYTTMLQKEYRFLQKKYDLPRQYMNVHFLRMRPANFPTIRLAQLAALISESNHLFSKIISVKTLRELEQLFSVTANDYWHYHYRLGDETGFKKKAIGKSMIRHIIINTVLPVIYFYGYYNNDESCKQRVIDFATALLPEKNNITSGFEELGISNTSAFDSQALIQLKNEYCDKKRCLECAVGNAILKRNDE